MGPGLVPMATSSDQIASADSQELGMGQEQYLGMGQEQYLDMGLEQHMGMGLEWQVWGGSGDSVYAKGAVIYHPKEWITL